MCPFNTDEGTCSVYPVRPGVCRTTHALDTNEKCQGQSDTIHEIKHPAVESTIAGQQAMREILHETQRPGAGSDIMPKAVMRHLAKATAFPNQPCPCGSGLKFKRCCGA
ncbi:MAG: SEC-C domain-containing protein [Myxococcales bacterium]|nr:SEC-C domain-containing protein [Myxococcales bacterium]